MNLQTIQEKLNKEFESIDRKLVFWFDDNGEFAEDIDKIELSNAKLYRLEKDNFFYTKYFLEKEDTESNYLIYAPFPKPADRDNHLTDTIYYSKEFFADKVSLLCVDLNIPVKYKDHLALYPTFWKANARIEKFMSLGIESYDNESIDIGLLSAITNVKTPNFEEVIKTIFLSDSYKENKYIGSFEKMGLTKVFWQLCEKFFGYADENQNPTLDKLFICMLITHFKHEFKGELPKGWLPFVSSKENNVFTFVKNIMSNVFCTEKYDAVSRSIAGLIKVNQFIFTVEISDILKSDTFEAIDTKIIRWIIERLKEENTSATAGNLSILNLIENRSSDANHYNKQFANEYQVLRFACKFIDLYHSENYINENDIVRAYLNTGYNMDYYYRRFYFYFDKLESSELLYDIKEIIEKIYTNEFLEKVNKLFNEYIQKKDMFLLSKQSDFYKSKVSRFVSKERIVVIISDAFRYECAKELCERLAEDAYCEASLDWMVGNVPSYTKLGMASLLPHKSIKYDSKFKITVNDMPCDDVFQREKILQSYVPNSYCYKFDEIKDKKGVDLKPLFVQKDVIYIYHNQIDARGDEVSSEDEVFNACHEAITEIFNFIKKLTNISVSKFIVTADHGFIYKREKIEEFEKVDNLSSIKEPCYKNKRFVLTTEPLELMGTRTDNLSYLGEDTKDIYVTVPVGVNILKVSGGGQKYVHGGASLQEIIIPVLNVKTAKGSKNVKNVEVILSSLSRKITNLITYIDFMQKENVTDVILASELKLYFVNQDGEKISSENIINANKKNAIPENRLFHEKFTLKNRKYTSKEKYYLIIEDLNEGTEVDRYEYIIDIAFADDFGFSI